MIQVPHCHSYNIKVRITKAAKFRSSQESSTQDSNNQSDRILVPYNQGGIIKVTCNQGGPIQVQNPLGDKIELLFNQI